jgi:ABC-type nitrate/sulfonate/bicarbonate transport system permease component
VIRGLLPVLVLLTGWQLIGDRASVTLPPPAAWYDALAGLHRAGELWPAVGSTFLTYVLALLCAMVAGTTLGVLLGAAPAADRLLTLTLDVAATLLGAAVVPVLILLLGTGRLTSVALVALTVVWPILHGTTAAVRGIPPTRIDAAATLGLRAYRRWTRVLLPSVVPQLFVALRVASAVTLIVTLLTDILGTGTGVGRLLVVSQQRFDAAACWGLLLVVGTIGCLASATLAQVDARLARRRGDAHRRDGKHFG